MSLPRSNLRGSQAYHSNLRNSSFCIANDVTHRDGVYRIVTGNGEYTRPVSHDYVFALPRDVETDFFKRPNRVEVVDSGKFRHD